MLLFSLRRVNFTVRYVRTHTCIYCKYKLHVPKYQNCQYKYHLGSSALNIGNT